VSEETGSSNRALPPCREREVGKKLLLKSWRGGGEGAWWGGGERRGGGGGGGTLRQWRTGREGEGRGKKGGRWEVAGGSGNKHQAGSREKETEKADRQTPKGGKKTESIHRISIRAFSMDHSQICQLLSKLSRLPRYSTYPGCLRA